MSDLRRICHHIKSETARILELWEERTRQEPWLDLPDEARIDHVPELLDALVDSVLCQPSGRESRERVVRVALEHGKQRCRDGFDDRILYQEYHILRSCVWIVIRDREHGRDWESFDVISRLDVAITVATNASLQGFHSHASRRDETAPERVERLMEAGPWPRLTEEDEEGAPGG